jgi:hypothetical protein
MIDQSTQHKDFQFTIAGKVYTVPAAVFVEATKDVTATKWHDKDKNCLFAAKEAFFKSINAIYYLDDSRSFRHTLHIDGVLVWVDYWKDRAKENLMANLFESLADYIYEIGIISKPLN